MLRVECESCKAPYQVDERRIPATGLKMRCPKCGHTFVVKAGAGEVVPPPDPHARPAPGSPAPAPAPVVSNQRKMQATMLGVGSGISKPPPTLGKDASAAPPLPTSPKPDAVTLNESEVGLPAAKPAAAKPPVPVPVARPGVKSAFKGTIVSAAPAPQLKITDADLPATREEVGLPVTRSADVGLPLPVARAGAAHAKPVPAAPPVPAAKKASPSSPDFGEIDLPSPAGSKPNSPPLGLELDLPVASPANGGVGLPVAKPTPPSRPHAPPRALGPSAPTAPAFPAVKGAASAAAPTPAPVPKAAVPASAEADFGEIDLPTLGAGTNLPVVATNNLPAVADALPSVADALPSPVDAFPSVADSLPSPIDAFPTAANVLPVVSNVLPNLKPATPAAAPMSLDASDLKSAPPDAMTDFGDFGELDLPPAPSPNLQATPRAPAVVEHKAPSPASNDDSFSFGELDLPPPPALEMGSLPPAPTAGAKPVGPPPPSNRTPSADLAFGEVDLALGDGGSSIEADASIPVAPREATESRSAVEEAIPTAPRSATNARAPAPPRSKTSRRVGLAVFVVLVVGGGALELTPYGAFGRLAVVDVLSASEYAKRADDVAAASRRKMASDLFSDARAAADQAATARSELPRARALTAYAALLECETQLRFGSAADRVPRVRQWLAEVAAQGGDAKLLPIAQAAHDALTGDAKKARSVLDAASKRDVGDPIQEDIALVRGELELAQKDPRAALTAFTQASQVQKTARSEFGRARALLVTRDFDAAKKALEETLKLSPKHVDARIERATMLWNQSKDEAAALADLAQVLEGEAKALASDSAKAQAHSLRGWIHAGRGRAGDARTSFADALKLDSRNVRALVGQGEVLFNEGRFTEALTRFDTAVQTDPSSVLAIVSDAKAKLALERLAPAKTQLAAARAAFPKDWRVAYWLGKAELALGNKPAAEKELVQSLELVDIKDPDAIQPFVALATLYAAQGKSKDAEARLADAKAKLPDSASLRRALGEVAASRGDFEGAVQNFRIAMEKDPLDLSTRFRLGVTLRRMRKIEEATTEFDKIVAIDKDYPGLSLERGLLYEESGDIDKALEQFQGALAKAPDDADLQLRVGAAYAAIGRPGDAVPMLRKVLDKRPQSADANHFLGRALFLQSGPAQAEAMRYLKRAVDLDPNRAEYHLYVGWAANNAIPAQLGIARDAIEKALGIDKLLADAYWQRGVVGRKEGAVDDAIRDLKRALELKPTRIDAHAALAECYNDKNDVATAMAEWQKAISADATKPDWRFKYGKLLFIRGNTADAAKHLVFAADEGEKLEPMRPGWLAEAEFLSGEVLRKAGKKAEAIERYRRFLEIAPTNSPDRKDALAALNDLGAKPNPR